MHAPGLALDSGAGSKAYGRGMVTRTISQAAADADVSADTLRYYEREGLLGPTERTPSGYRLYTAQTVERVRFIKGAQRVGLRLTDIKDLLDIRDRGACPCGHTRTLIGRRLTDIDEQVRRLGALRSELVVLLGHLDECPEPEAGRWSCETEFIRKGGENR
jgi:DNA-binding transcriptional MerR regulator